MTVVLAITTILTVKADNDKPVGFNQLPDISKKFIQTYFNQKDISYSKVDNDFFDKSYEVFFVNGSKVEFNKKGEWEVVDCLNSQIPKGIIPTQISKYVEANHPGCSIVKIDRDSKDYEIQLNNNLEIKFDLKYNVIGYDD